MARALLFSFLSLFPADSRADDADPPLIATFSMVAVDPAAGVCGAIVASKYPAVGNVVPHVRAGVGAFCTQHWGEAKWGERALDLLAKGKLPEEVLGEILRDDPRRDKRQLAIIDMEGRAASRNPSGADPSGIYWGASSGRYYACQGNTLAGREVIAAMARAYEETRGSLADRLMAALIAGDCAGGDHRGRLAAGLKVARRGGEGAWLDLQVDQSGDAVIDLARKYAELSHEAKGEWRGGRLPFEHPCPGPPAPAAARPLPPQEGRPGGYPRIDLAIAYRNDPTWPRRPEGMEWGDMPGIAVDSQDQVWLFTRASPPVQVYRSSGEFVRAWGQNLVKKAHHLKIDSRGNVWLADVGHHVVMQLTPEGKLLRTLGTRGEPGDGDSRFNQPTDMAITPAGEVFVSDGYGNNRVVHFDSQGKFVKAWGKMGVGPGEFSLPHAIGIDSRGRLYVADRNNVRIQVFDREGKFLSEWRNLLVPWGLWVSKEDEVWACGSSPMTWGQESSLGAPPRDQVLMRFSTDGKLLQLWTVPKGEDGRERPGEVNWVHCIAQDSRGDLYLGDIRGKRAQKLVRQDGRRGPSAR